jgi:hypothetical protein
MRTILSDYWHLGLPDEFTLIYKLQNANVSTFSYYCRQLVAVVCFTVNLFRSNVLNRRLRRYLAAGRAVVFSGL